MATPKYKHLKFEDRHTIQEFLRCGYSFTSIAKRLGKDRRGIAKEVLKHRFLKPGKNSIHLDCPTLSKPPYVCNGCPDRVSCRKDQYIYEASIAQNEYEHTLRREREGLHITKEEIAAINETISPLMVQQHHSVNHIYAAHPELLPMSKSTFYRYVDLGILDVRNIDLPRKVKYHVKKEYRDDYTREMDKSYKFGRFYRDFQDYLEYNSPPCIVEMDTLIGTQGGKGGKCFLTLLICPFNLMIIRVLPYRKADYVTQAFMTLKELLGDDEFSRLFPAILTDNGSEFSDPDSIELSAKTGDRLSFVFYCDPNCSWQKGHVEKNHEYIRYVLPKGTSFAGISQENANLLASHINSVPRLSLNNQSPYEAALGFVGKHTMDLLGIQRIANDDINLTRSIFNR